MCTPIPPMYNDQLRYDDPLLYRKYGIVKTFAHEHVATTSAPITGCSEATKAGMGYTREMDGMLKEARASSDVNS